MIFLELSTRRKGEIAEFHHHGAELLPIAGRAGRDGRTIGGLKSLLAAFE
jgi:hypothetical protein